MRAAIVHYWLLNRRGGEKVLDALCRLLPKADIFTLFCDREVLSPTLRGRRITTSFLDPYKLWYRSLLPLMPLALESFDLRGYDLVVSSESGPAKGVITSATTRHVCYCHTPMRYLWDLYPAYRNEWTRSRMKRALMAPLANYLRLWDFASAARVDEFVANSRNVQQRIWKTYRRESEVIYPPVDVESFYTNPAEDYFLIVSELVAYKRIDSAIAWFARTGRRLRIAGMGPEYGSLRGLASGHSNIEFLGRVADYELRELYARCRAFLLPGEEDFGMTPVEALASGKPVIALGRGGALETVPSFGGVFYDDPAEIGDAIARFEAMEAGIRPADLQAWAQRFSEAEFVRKMSTVLELRSPAVRR
jgi:glycosyltransferase involved in cell wall biosynthesis